MCKIYSNEFFNNKSEKDLNLWVATHRKVLVGSAIFTSNNSITSKVVRWAENWGEKNKKKFTPSHTGSIIEYEGELLIFDMKPLRATTTPLTYYLLNTSETFSIVQRNFKLDTRMFSLNIAEHIGEFYPFMSAIRSVFSKRQSKWRTHCSELHARVLQLCGYKFQEDFNMECTPLELFNVLKK